MTVTLKLEAIGDDERHWWMMYAASLQRQTPGLARFLRGVVPRPAVWRLVRDETGVVRRQALAPKVDFSEANARGSRGIFLYFHLQDGGMYEVREVLGRRHAQTYYCRAERGYAVRIEREEALG